MPRFLYQALNESQEIVSGDVLAESAREAITELESRGLAVQSIRIETLEPMPPEREAIPPKAARSAAALPADYDASAAESVLQKQLAKLLARGRTLTPALRAYVEELPEGSERRELSAVCNSIDSGDAAAASKAMAALPEYWIPLLSSAAASGDAGRVIRDFLHESSAAGELRWQRWRSAAYPILVGVIGLAVATALSLTVLPIFHEMFVSFGLELPALTHWIFAVGRGLVWGWGVAAAVVLLLAVLTINGTLPGVRRLRASRLGSWFGRSTAVAQFTRFAAELLSAGVSRGDAVRIAAHTTRHPAMQRAGWELAGALEDDLDDPPPAPRPVPATAVYALHGDLPAAARARLLAEISGCYSDRASRRLSWTRGLIGPAAILVIGIGVGVVVLALFLPLVSLVNNLAG